MLSRRWVRANNGIGFRPDANTVLWLPGQDDPQSSTIRDRSGNGNDGTITGATWATIGTGLVTLNFDGDDKVAFGDVLDVTTNDFTLEAWVSLDVRADGVDGYAALFYKREGTVGFGMYFLDTGAIGIFIGDAGGNSSPSQGSGYDDTVWRHYATRWDRSGNVDFVVNGASIGVGDISLRTGTLAGATDFYLGVYSSGAHEFLKGQVGLARMHDTLKTVDFLKGHYNEERSLFGV